MEKNINDQNNFADIYENLFIADKLIFKAKIMEKLNEDALYIQYLDDYFRNDKDIVMLAVTNNIYSLKFASEKLRNDKAFLLEILKYQANKISKLKRGKLSKKNIDNARIEVSYILKYASEDLKNDSTFVLKFIKLSTYSLKYVSEELMSDSYFLLDARSKYGINYFRDLPLEFKNNKSFILKNLSFYTSAIACADIKLRSDKEFMLSAVKINFEAFKYSTTNLRKDEDFVLECMKINKECLKYVPSDIKYALIIK